VAILNIKKLDAHRVHSFRLPPGKPISTLSQAVTFVNQRGFIYFWPIRGIDLPSLWTAVAGQRPVPNEHDDPGHVTWRWKDSALPRRLWYYAKILRRKATMISLDIAPYFYALSENYGSPEEDYLLAYEEGRLTQAAKNVYETLLKEGALDSISLRKASRLTSAKESEWNRALEDLQKDFKILPVGIAEAGAWKYAFIYQVVERYYPDLSEHARQISETDARARLLELYFASVGAAQLRDVTKLFGWGAELTSRVLTRLMEHGKLMQVLHPDKQGDWFALVSLCN
jgi:Winged helix DNA-binding domain